MSSEGEEVIGRIDRRCHGSGTGGSKRTITVQTRIVAVFNRCILNLSVPRCQNKPHLADGALARQGFHPSFAPAVLLSPISTGRFCNMLKSRATNPLEPVPGCRNLGHVTHLHVAFTASDER